MHVPLNNTHEHACIRCNFLHVHPDAAARLDLIEQDLQQRLEEASTKHWLADVEQLKVTLRRLNDKRLRLPESSPGGDATWWAQEPMEVHPLQ